MTKREMYETLVNFLFGNDAFVADMGAGLAEEIIDKLAAERDRLSRPSTADRKPTATQIENEGFRAAILDALGTISEPVTIKGLVEICSDISELSNQRITHLLTALRKEGKVKRTYIKKVAYFELGQDEAYTAEAEAE